MASSRNRVSLAALRIILNLGTTLPNILPGANTSDEILRLEARIPALSGCYNHIMIISIIQLAMQSYW